jgi:hypothetical protein
MVNFKWIEFYVNAIFNYKNEFDNFVVKRQQ